CMFSDRLLVLSSSRLPYQTSSPFSLRRLSTSSMNYDDHTPADPTNSHAVDPSSPPSLEEGSSAQGSSAFPTSSSGLPRFPQVKLRIKLGRETPGSATQIMESSVSYKYDNNEDERETSGEESSFRFSEVNTNAVRSQLNLDTNNGSEANGGKSESDNDEASEGKTPKRERRERKVVEASPVKSAKKKGGKKGKKAKGGEKVVALDEDEKEDDEIYEVERIIDHTVDDDGKLLYKVKWCNYGPEYDTYEPVENLGTARQRIEEYKRNLPVESRQELEAVGSKRKKGRPSTASKAGKRPRSDYVKESDESEEEEKASDDDDDYGADKKASKKKATAPAATSSTSRTRGRPSKGALKQFPVPTPVTTPRKKEFLVNRQGWLSESDSNDSEMTEEPKPKKEESTPPKSTKRETSGRKRGSAVSEEASTSNGGGQGGCLASFSFDNQTSMHNVGGGLPIEGMYRQESGEVMVLMGEGREQRDVSLRDAFESNGWGLVQFFLDRCQFAQ
ncbi:hypothetical protein PFISCL1PPCAC_24803, partial [Pristionchus fissidentatus]